MERLLLSIILSGAGLSAVSSAAGRHYYFMYGRKNFTEAQKYCREKYTDLVSVDTLELMRFLSETADLDHMVYSNNSYRAWIGLYDDHVPTPWTWSLSNPSFYKPGESEYRRWGTGEPLPVFSGKSCVWMQSLNGLWYADRCDQDLECPVCMVDTGSKVTFVLVTTSMTWTEAQRYCRAHHTDLASVRNSIDNTMIQDLISGEQRAWIGLNRDPWKWSDGTNSSFSFWKTGQPDINININNTNNINTTNTNTTNTNTTTTTTNTTPTTTNTNTSTTTTTNTNTSTTTNTNNPSKTCAAADFSQSGAWEEWPCDVRRAFICYGPVEWSDPVVPVIKKVMKVKFETKENLDLNDPAVLAAMLDQIQQKLRDQVLDKNIKLSWRKQDDGDVFHQEEEEEEEKEG